MAGQVVENVGGDIPAAPQKKVLVIDDNPTIVELIRHAVRMQGKYDVVVAYDGEQGLEQFYNERPDCVIVDVRMPNLDGYQVVRCIRGDSEMTGLLSGVDEYLAKPFKPSVLCATLERVMQITPEEREQRLVQLAAEDPRG
jgi:DNA-binding response OmpR family regulator